MYEVIVSKSAQKSFSQLPQVMQERVLGVLERISLRPYAFVRKLAGSHAYRLRVGKYRLILDINEKANRIEVLLIGNRENIYEKI